MEKQGIIDDLNKEKRNKMNLELVKLYQQYHTAMGKQDYELALELNQNLYQKVFDMTLGNTGETKSHDELYKLIDKGHLERLAEQAEKLQELIDFKNLNNEVRDFLDGLEDGD